MPPSFAYSPVRSFTTTLDMYIGRFTCERTPVAGHSSSSAVNIKGTHVVCRKKGAINQDSLPSIPSKEDINQDSLPSISSKEAINQDLLPSPGA